MGPVQVAQCALKDSVEMAKYVRRTVKGKRAGQTDAAASVVSVMDSVMLEFV